MAWRGSGKYEEKTDGRDLILYRWCDALRTIFVFKETCRYYMDYRWKQTNLTRKQIIWIRNFHTVLHHCYSLTIILTPQHHEYIWMIGNFLSSFRCYWVLIWQCKSEYKNLKFERQLQWLLKDKILYVQLAKWILLLLVSWKVWCSGSYIPGICYVCYPAHPNRAK